MLGRGNFALKQENAHLVTVDEWRRISEKQRDKSRDQYFRYWGLLLRHRTDGPTVHCTRRRTTGESRINV